MMESICRVCLQDKNICNDSEFISIFRLDENNENLFNKIMKCAQVEITENDPFPKEICSHCVGNLNIAYKFKIQCEKSNESFKDFLNKKSTVIDESKGFENDDTNPDVVIKKKIKKKLKNVIVRSAKNGMIQKQENKLKNKCKEIKHDVIENNLLIKEEKHAIEIKIEPLDETIARLEFEDNACDGVENDFDLEKALKFNKKRRGRPRKIHYDNSGNIIKLTKKPFVCDQCGRSFKSMESLRGHQRRHTGEKPYMCSTCGKSFHVLNELKKHLNTHTGTKPYKCQYCERLFSDWGSRFKHERCHRGERPYQCDVCPKTFSYSYVLNRHKLTHSGDKKFSCDLCKKNFTLKYHLTNHNRKYHKEVKNTQKASNEVSDNQTSLPKLVEFRDNHQYKEKNSSIHDPEDCLQATAKNEYFEEKSSYNDHQVLDSHSEPNFHHPLSINIKDEMSDKYFNVLITSPNLMTKHRTKQTD